ncbi:ATP-binding protein, partial [Actinotalea fermentans ATCC 43279 = JCM 9966 = DSM 3133]
TSLHPELLPALGALVAGAARRTQVVVVTHSQALVRAMEDAAGGARAASRALVHVELVKELGQTTVAGREGPLDQPQWHWPKR